MSMTSSKPYLIRAMYDWIVDNDLTPYIVFDATADQVDVPQEYIEDGRIVLNISPQATRGLHLENERIIFSARFSGVPTQISAPPTATLALYAKENGRGMVFADEDEDGGSATGGPDSPTPPQGPGPSGPSGGGRRSGGPKLRRVK